MGSQSAFCHNKLVCIDLGKVCKFYPFCKFYLSPAVFTAEKYFNIFLRCWISNIFLIVANLFDS